MEVPPEALLTLLVGAVLLEAALILGLIIKLRKDNKP